MVTYITIEKSLGSIKSIFLFPRRSLCTAVPKEKEKVKEKVKEKGKTAELAIKSLETDDAYLLINILSIPACSLQ